MNRTSIEYLTHTWNPTVGCNGVDCSVRKHCWAMAMAKRQRRCVECYHFVPHLHKERLLQPLQRKKPARIGVSFMGDFYDTALSFEDRERVLWVISACPQHAFLILTKQPQNIPFDLKLPKNLWLGVSVNKKQDIWRIETLLQRCGNCKSFVSFEPLYEDMDDIDLRDLDWIIIGAQTRPELQPDPYWVWSLVTEAQNHNIPIFLKNNLDYGYVLQEFPKGEEKT